MLLQRCHLARRCIGAPGVLATLALTGLPSLAAAATAGAASTTASPVPAAASQGWFASLALLAVLLAGASGYLLGQVLTRRRLERELFALRVQHQALLVAAGQAAAYTAWQTVGPTDGPVAGPPAIPNALQAQPAFCWHSDAQHQLLHCSGPGQPPAIDSMPALPPAWFMQPDFQQALATGQALAGLTLLCPGPAGAPAQTWWVHAQPLLDTSGRFAGYMGTARVLPATLAGTQAPTSGTASPSGASRTSLAATATGAAGTSALPSTASPVPVLTANTENQVITASSDAEEADSFSFTVSHDLKAPIRVVEGFTRIVKEDYGQLLDRVGNDHLDRVLGAAARMNLMIDALLTLARLSKQPLARQPVNLSQIAHYVVDELRRGQPDRNVGVDIEEGLQAEGDPTLLRLVLENLLGNAWKYSERNPQAQLSLRSVPHGAGRAFVVRDNGAGFDMRSAERLFGLFQRLHSASEFPGHGVGLASVRRIVRRHGGDIWAEAEPARGAAFTFTLGGG